jgi:hypothetical protein
MAACLRDHPVGQHDDVVGVAQERPGQRDALPLTARQQHPGLRIVLVGQIVVRAAEGASRR